jgi:hypothetical protein
MIAELHRQHAFELGLVHPAAVGLAVTVPASSVATASSMPIACARAMRADAKPNSARKFQGKVHGRM